MSFDEDFQVLTEDLQKLQKIYEDLAGDDSSNDDSTALPGALCKKIENSLRSLKGITHGHLQEVERASKHYAKRRTVLLQVYGDVTIGQKNDLFAKTLQLKSSYGPTAGDVDTYLAKAAYQISGAKGEMPRQNDRRVIDVSVLHTDNRWPYNPTVHAKDSLSDLLRTAEKRILKYVDEKKPDRERGLTDVCKAWLTDVADYKSELGAKITTAYSARAGEKSTLLRLASKSGPPEKYIFEYITIKIRFNGEREVKLRDGSKDYINAAIFVIVKVGQQVPVEPKKKDKYKSMHKPEYRLEQNLRCEYIAYDLRNEGKSFFDLNTVTSW